MESSSHRSKRRPQHLLSVLILDELRETKTVLANHRAYNHAQLQAAARKKSRATARQRRANPCAASDAANRAAARAIVVAARKSATARAVSVGDRRKKRRSGRPRRSSAPVTTGGFAKRHAETAAQVQLKVACSSPGGSSAQRQRVPKRSEETTETSTLFVQCTARGRPGVRPKPQLNYAAT